MPAVELVNFTLDHGDIIIRTDHSGKLEVLLVGGKGSMSPRPV